MVALRQAAGDVVLFSPTESLLLQVARWCRQSHTSVRLVTSTLPAHVDPALQTAVFSLVDATAQPEEAMAILENGVNRVGTAKIAVYTEVMHENMELFVRTRGATIVLGPLPAEQWKALLAPAGGTEAPLSMEM